MRHFLIQTYKHAKFQQNLRWSAKEGCELTWNVPTPIHAKNQLKNVITAHYVYSKIFLLIYL